MVTVLGRVAARRLLPSAGELAVVAGVALALGVLTAYARGWLPDQLGPLASTTGAWALAAFALAATQGTRTGAALVGALALVGLLAGYVLGAHLRGFPVATRLEVWWAVTAIVVGPVIGWLAHRVRYGSDRRAVLAAGIFAGVLCGEAVYGLTASEDSTWAPYWWGQLLVGLGLFVGVAYWRRVTEPLVLARAAAAGALVALLFVAIYRHGPLL